MATVMDGASLPLTPDFHDWPHQHRIVAASAGSGLVGVCWSDGRTSRFHPRWLRDNCPCPGCLNPSSREQIFDVSTLDHHLGVAEAGVDALGALTIAWSGEDHRSRFHPGWLRAHDYSNPGIGEDSMASRSVTWDAGMADRIPTFVGDAVLADDSTLLDWLTALCEVGLTRLTGVDPGATGVLDVAARIGIVRDTVFGRTFQVRSEARPVSNAYTDDALLPHTDLPTRELQPGIQMLHCRANAASGGESVMVDGFRLAELIRARYPAAFETLTTTPLEYASRGADSEYRWRAPMVALDGSGAVTELRPGALVRAPVQAPFDRMEAIYDAIAVFYRLSRDPGLRAEFPIRTGDLLAFDNRRVLHARNAFDACSRERHLEGCYLDRDELYSRLRVLRRRGVRSTRTSGAPGFLDAP